jgi:hypothetical protein
VEIHGGTAIAPGSGVGTLNIIGGGSLWLRANSNYEWEVGSGGTDTINITGGRLDLDNFNLKILDAGGFVADAADQLTVFTYTYTSGAGDTAVETQLNSVVIDPTALDSERWNVGIGFDGLALIDDGSGTIYLTGLVRMIDVNGDADGDMDVDSVDLAIFKAQFGGAWNSVLTEDPDFDNDGLVTLADFAIMRGNWGVAAGARPEASDLVSTPEPATMSLLAVGGLLTLRKRRRKA